MSTIYQITVGTKPVMRVYVKGASEIIMDRCKRLHLANNNIKE
jgi:magnesium-transporting ATPase (P-type)